MSIRNLWNGNARLKLAAVLIPPKSISTIVAALAVLVLAAVAVAQNQSFAIPVGSGAEPPLFSGLGPFNPSDARVTAPFMVSGTNVFQTVQTNDPSSGGDLEFRFNAPLTADYQVSALLDCSDSASNSFYINIDGQPIDPTMIWDVPITTSGFERRTASWRGTATGGSPPQFYPKIWHLTQGEHLFVIRGREANAIIGPLTIGISAIWKMQPVSGDWNNASNWTPTTVPNGSADAATFGVSNTTAISISAPTTVSGITFTPGASPFTITATQNDNNSIITINGIGITNDSGVVQNFVANTGGATGFGYKTVVFTDQATAGSLTRFTINSGGSIHFTNDSTAGNGVFVVNSGGHMRFDYPSTAGSGTFTVNGGGDLLAHEIAFFDSSAGSGTFTINVGSAYFGDSSTAANAILTANGNPVGGSSAGAIIFFNVSTAGSATLIANGGTNGGAGGAIAFLDGSQGGTARVKVFGNGALIVASRLTPGVTTGSLEGDGFVFIGSGIDSLTLGSNNLSTTFSGVIHDNAASDPGSLTKIGTGTLTLSGANTYTGGTIVSGATVEASHDRALGLGDVTLTVSGTKLTLQSGATNDYIFDGARLSIITGAVVNLSYTGSPEVVGFLIVNGVSQPAGLYGGVASGAPNQLPQFSGTGKILVTTPVAFSRRMHGATNFDINLPFSGLAGVECRSAGTNNGYQIIVSFGLPITFSSASITSGTGTIASTTGNGTETLTVNLTGVVNAQRLTVTFSGVNYGAATGDVPIRMSVLIGDTTGNEQVNSTDISQTKAESGHALTNSNFRQDVTVSGSISSSDVSLVKSHSGSALPP